MQRRYYLVADHGNEYSADARDYWHMPDSAQFEGSLLVRAVHPFRTVTGRVVFASRVLKSDPTVGDLRRLASANA